MATTTGLINGLVHTADVVVLLEVGEVADTANDTTPVGVTCMSAAEEEGAVEELRWEADTVRGETATVEASYRLSGTLDTAEAREILGMATVTAIAMLGGSEIAGVTLTARFTAR